MKCALWFQTKVSCLCCSVSHLLAPGAQNTWAWTAPSVRKLATINRLLKKTCFWNSNRWQMRCMSKAFRTRQCRELKDLLDSVWLYALDLFISILPQDLGIFPLNIKARQPFTLALLFSPAVRRWSPHSHSFRFGSAGGKGSALRKPAVKGQKVKIWLFAPPNCQTQLPTPGAPTPRQPPTSPRALRFPPRLLGSPAPQRRP